MRKPWTTSGRWWVGLGALALLGACSSSAAPFELRTFPPGREQQVLPEATVERSGTVMRVSNGSHMTIGPGRMWVNQEFSCPIAGIMPGETVEIDLKAFRNEHGEKFRAGGFWATDPPKRVGLVQVEPEGNGERLLGLVVTKDERR